MSHLKEIENWVLDACETAYHPSCSAKMGTADDPMAVVDSSCRVFGTQNLRVVDSSIMPSGSIFIRNYNQQVFAFCKNRLYFI